LRQFKTNGQISALLSTGKYPSAVDECQQSIQAAHDVQNSAYTTTSTKFFSVAYGAYTVHGSKSNQGCPFDTDATVTPCTTMENLATDMTYFYSDYLQSGSGSSCGSNTLNHDLTSLKQIFLDIGGKLTHPRLLPNSSQDVLIE
jgi:hypothetical protein